LADAACLTTVGYAGLAESGCQHRKVRQRATTSQLDNNRIANLP
jgi:hypothetical protein